MDRLRPRIVATSVALVIAAVVAVRSRHWLAASLFLLGGIAFGVYLYRSKRM